MFYADKLIVMPEHATLAPPICRLAGEVLSIGRRVTQKGVLDKVCLVYSEYCYLKNVGRKFLQTKNDMEPAN